MSQPEPEPDEIAEILSADVAILYQIRMVWYILLIRRAAGKTFEGLAAFAGGRKEGKKKDKGKLRNTAVRETEEEVGIRLKVTDLTLIVELDGPDRDPRPGERTSLVYAAVVDASVALAAVSPEGLELIRTPLADVTPEMMAFDHYDGILALRERYVDHD